MNTNSRGKVGAAVSESFAAGSKNPPRALSPVELDGVQGGGSKPGIGSGTNPRQIATHG